MTDDELKEFVVQTLALAKLNGLTQLGGLSLDEEHGQPENLFGYWQTHASSNFNDLHMLRSWKVVLKLCGREDLLCD